MSERPCAECGKVCKPCPDCDRCEKCCEEFNGFDAPSLAPAPAAPRSKCYECDKGNTAYALLDGTMAHDIRLQGSRSLVAAPCINAPAAYAPRGICPSCGHPPHGKHHSGEMSNNPERVHCGCSAAHAPRAEELEYTVQESFVIQHEDGGDIIGIPVIEGITAQEAQAQGMKWINERIRPVRYRLVHRTVVITDKMV